MTLGSEPTVSSVEAAAYTVPTEVPEADGTAHWDSTTLVLARVSSGDRTGTGWTYGPVAVRAVIADLLADQVTGARVFDTTRVWTDMRRTLRNATTAGVAGYAISAVDVAMWDLKARILGVSLRDLLGAARDDVPVYGSGGFTTYTDEQTAGQLAGWAETQQIPRVKIKIGDGLDGHPRDIERITLARSVIGPDAELFVDGNGAYQAKEAIRLLRAVEEARVTWFEEPVSSDDLSGLKTVREAVEADVTAGEYGSDIAYFQRMCAAESVDCLQIDATRCGGYTEFVRGAAVAASHGLDVSAHCAPNLHAPVAAATPRLRHIEWFHDHVRIEERLFEGALDPAGGVVRPDRTSPGHGLAFRDRDAEPFRVA